MNLDQEHELRYRREVSELDRRIEKLKRLALESITDGSREFWRAQVEVLERQRKDFEVILHRERISKSLDLLGR